MPLYEYQCQACGKKFEVIQKFSDAPLTTHPECGGAAEKLVSAPAFHLKGTGWYATDYAKSNASTSTKTEDSKPSETATPASSEAKPAASETKSESKESSPAPAASTK